MKKRATAWRPRFPAKVRNGLDVGDGRRAGFQKHVRAVAATIARIRNSSTRIWRRVMSGIQSVKVFGGGNCAGHVGVIQMAVRVDEAGKQNDFAEIKNFFVCGRSQFQVRPRTDGADAVSRDDDRAVFNRRLLKPARLSARGESLLNSGGALGVFEFGGVLVFVRLVSCCGVCGFAARFFSSRLSIAAYRSLSRSSANKSGPRTASRIEQVNCFSGTRLWSCSSVTRASTARLSKWSSFWMRLTTWSSMDLVSVTLCVERINFIFPRCN